jgi:hypothetical protein
VLCFDYLHIALLVTRMEPSHMFVSRAQLANPSLRRLLLQDGGPGSHYANVHSCHSTKAYDFEPHRNSPYNIAGKSGLRHYGPFSTNYRTTWSECHPKDGRMAIRVEYHIAKIARPEVRNILRQANRSQLTLHPRLACTCSGQGEPLRAERNRSS